MDGGYDWNNLDWYSIEVACYYDYYDVLASEDVTIHYLRDMAYDLVLPANLTVVEAEAFSGGRFRSVAFSDKLERIEAHAFDNCLDLLLVYIPGNVKYIDPAAFGDEIEKLVIVGVSNSGTEDFANDNQQITIVPAS